VKKLDSRRACAAVPLRGDKLSRRAPNGRRMRAAAARRERQTNAGYNREAPQSASRTMTTLRAGSHWSQSPIACVAGRRLIEAKICRRRPIRDAISGSTGSDERGAQSATMSNVCDTIIQAPRPSAARLRKRQLAVTRVAATGFVLQTHQQLMPYLCHAPNTVSKLCYLVRIVPSPRHARARCH
jgi:hypothetical protein